MEILRININNTKPILNQSIHIIQKLPKKYVVIIVSHPNDIIFWVGGVILKNQKTWNIFIVCLYDKQNEESTLMFQKSISALKIKGVLINISNGAKHKPPCGLILQKTIIKNLPTRQIDLIITYSPKGKQARYPKDIGKSVIILWHEHKISTNGLWCFAYQDENQSFYPRAIIGADFYYPLHDLVVRAKHKLLNKIYGIGLNSKKMLNCPSTEAFWSFTTSSKAFHWLNRTT